MNLCYPFPLPPSEVIALRLLLLFPESIFYGSNPLFLFPEFLPKMSVRDK